MFDQNGIWQDDIYHAPGPSGGATGALDLMNVMQSGQNYQSSEDEKHLAVLLKLLKDQNASAVMGNPLAASATGMNPDDLQNAYASTPMGQFHSYAEQHPTAGMGDYFQKQVALGMTPPAQVATFAKTEMTDQHKWDRELKALDVKDRKAVLDAAAK